MAYIGLGLKTSVAIISTLLLTHGLLAESGDFSKSKESQTKLQQAATATGQLSADRQASRVSGLIEADKSATELAKKSDRPERDPTRLNKSTSLDFDISSVSVTLDYDQDLDGYYSEFTVNFDADTNYSYADVYAELYLSLNGGPWLRYHVTDVFEIQGWSYYDDYTVSTLLTEGYPPGSYDLLIDLIDTFDNSLVATISGDQLINMSNLPLEDLTYENSSSYSSSVKFFNAEIQLLTDQDNDGYYRSYSLQFDADVDAGSREIFAEIWMRDQTGTWQLETTTENILLQGNSTLDTYIIETILESGYATGYYDFKVDLFDATTSEFLTSSDDFDSQLSYVPLEDSEADTYVSQGTGTSVVSVSVESGGAGSQSILMLLLMLAGLSGRLMIRR